MTAVSRQVTDTPSVGEEGTGNAGRPRACRYTTIPSKIKSRTASHGLRCIRERRGGARGDDRACEGVVDGGAPPRAAAPGRRLAPAEVRAALRASERRAPACAGAHAACPAVRSERRAPARAAARAGCLGRRAAACVRRAAGVRSVGGSGRAAATSLGPHHVYACCVAGAGNDSDPAALRQPGAACGRRRAAREGERGGQRLEPGRPPHPEGAHARGTASSNADRPFRSPWPRTAHAVPGHSDSGLVCERWNWSGGDVAATAAAGAGLGGVRSSGGGWRAAERARACGSERRA